MTAINLKKIRTEWINFLRNSDIFTISQRGVTTDTDSGTWAATTTQLINRPNIRNIRSITVAGSPLTYGKDYYVNFDFDDSGTIKCKVFLEAAQTGAYVITYDYGTDKIFFDFPKDDLKISNFPRIGSGFVNVETIDAGFGGVLRNTIGITTIVYDRKTDSVSEYLDTLRAAIFAANNSFFYVGKYTKPISVGPVIKSPREQGRDKIFQQNIDIEGKFVHEK